MSNEDIIRYSREYQRLLNLSRVWRKSEKLGVAQSKNYLRTSVGINFAIG